MKRDFTEKTKQELLSLVKEVKDEQWCSGTDWIGDRWYDFEAWIGKLDVKDYVDNISSYHKKVIDKNNTTADRINEIFDNVNTTSNNYKSRFVAVLANIQEYTITIKNLAEVVSPENGKFNSEYIGNGLKNLINQYIENSKNLQKISIDGMSQKEANQLGEKQLKEIINLYAAIMLTNIPNIKVGDTVEIPIGPGVTIYYKVEGKVDGTSDADINYILEQQKTQINKIGYSYENGDAEISGKISEDGDISIESTNSSGIGVEISGDEGVSPSYEVKIDENTTYKYSYKYIPGPPPQLILEETVTTTTEGGSISTTVGIKYTEENGWKYMPEPVPIESPYTCQLPDWNWEELVGAVVAIAGVVYVVKKVAGVILLVPTGGTSVILVVT